MTVTDGGPVIRMPGVSLRYDVGAESARRQPSTDFGRSLQLANEVVESFTTPLDATCHADAYTAELLFDEEPLLLGRTTNTTYPVETFRTDGLTLCFEGKLYNVRDTRRELQDLASHVHHELDHRAIIDWLLETDGEFVLYLRDDRTDTLTVLNDVLGRLPLYLYRDDQAVLLSREVRFLLEAVEDIAFDSMGLAQCLLFGFPLGSRTLWTGVEKVDPATVLQIKPDGSITSERLFQFDFDRQPHAANALDDNAAALASLFCEAVRGRARHEGTNVVSLSGGHDSRAVAAGFHATDTPFTAATFSKPGGGTAADVRIAERVADALEVDWEWFDIDPPDGLTLAELLDWKAGLNHLGMAFILEFFGGIERRLGSDVVYFTGDGGDKTLPDLRPARSFGNVDEVISYLMRRDSLVFPLDDVVELTGVTEEELRTELRALLRQYPESTPEQLYKHFRVVERGGNWLFEGEDRNRCYFWSTTPFYAVPFFRYAMGCPDDQKAGNALYRAFIERLWPEATTFKDANYGVAMASPAYKVVQSLRSALARYPTVEDVVRVVYRNEVRYRYDEDIADVMADQLSNGDGVSTLLSVPALERIIDARTSCGRQQIFNLFTITSAIDRLEGDDALSDYEDRRFQ